MEVSRNASCYSFVVLTEYTQQSQGR